MRSSQLVKTPFASKVPRDIRENLRWRSKVHRRVMEDPEYAEVIREACSKDFVFWLTGFVWTYDPRQEPFPKLPFIPYSFQIQAALEIIFRMGRKDILIEKSRDMGASWLIVSIFVWFWLYHRDQSFLFGSRTENYVDQIGNPKSLFWKVEYIVDNMPAWLRPRGYDKKQHKRSMHIENPENGSVIDGEATSPQFARGDRRTAIMLDEFAVVDVGNAVLSATRDATKCRVFNSTPAGTGNAFYEVRESGIYKVRLHWSSHPIKSQGLYKTGPKGELEILDKKGWEEFHKEEALLLARWGEQDDLEPFRPTLDGKTRSPWYDGECARTPSAQEIAQELDIDYLGSGWQYFSPDRITEAIRKYARPPVLTGELEYDNETSEPIRFVENPKGSLRLWFTLGEDGKPLNEHKVSLGCDISAGTGASNSVASGWDSLTTEKIFEYVNPNIRPERFAKLAIALAKWLGNAFLIWEANGVGRQFGAVVAELHYGNIYLRRNEESIGRKVSNIPGWWATPTSKTALVGAYRDAVESDKCINRSTEALQETLEYVFSSDCSVDHAKASDKRDPSGARSNHGDRVIADALGIKGISERPTKSVSESPKVPIGSLAWRREMRAEMALNRTGYSSPNRELSSDWR